MSLPDTRKLQIHENWLKIQKELDENTFKSKYGLDRSKAEYLYLYLKATTKFEPKYFNFSSLLIFLNLLSCGHSKYLVNSSDIGLPVKVIEEKKKETAALIISSQNSAEWNLYNNSLQSKISKIYERIMGYRLFVTSKKTKVKKHIQIVGMVDGTLR